MWCDREQEAVSGVLGNAASVRLVLASLLRCQKLLEKVAKRKIPEVRSRHSGCLGRVGSGIDPPVGDRVEYRVGRSDVG